MTSSELAKLCGVTQMTVSRVFASPEKVKASTRERILKVAEKYRYRPNRLASAIDHGKTYTVGVVSIRTSLSYFHDISMGIQDTLMKQGYIPISMPMNWNDILPIIRRLVDHRVDGMIFTDFRRKLHPDELAELENFHIPYLFIGSDSDSIHLEDHIFTDDAQGTKEEAGYLRERGHRTAAVYFHGAAPADRLNLFSLHFKALGGKIVTLPENGLEQFYSDGFPASVIVCHTDVDAAKVMSFLNRRGVRVPNDISVIGYADLDFAAITAPPLTTIRQDGYRLGTLAANRILKRMANPELPVEDLPVPCSLIERESVADLRTHPIRIFRTSPVVPGRSDP